jgi:hypothetical protein
VASSFTTPAQEAVESPSRKIFSPTREILPLYFSHLERFQFGEASRVLALAAVRVYFVWSFSTLHLVSHFPERHERAAGIPFNKLICRNHGLVDVLTLESGLLCGSWIGQRTMDHVWVLLPHLQLLAACESIYHSLIFLEAFSTNQVRCIKGHGERWKANSYPWGSAQQHHVLTRLVPYFWLEMQCECYGHVRWECFWH